MERSDDATGTIVRARPGALAAAVGPWETSRDVAAAAACGPMFSSRGADYRLCDRARGVDVRSRYPSRGATVVVIGGVASMVDGDAARITAPTVAVQGYPELTRRGRVVVSGLRDLERVPRLAIGITDRGEVAIVYARAASTRTLAEWSLARGVTECVYLDGGTAAALRVDGVDVRAPRVPLRSVVMLEPRAAAGSAGTAAALLSVGLLALFRRRK